MSFEGPDPTDYENVVSLNRAYLSLLGRDRGLQAGLRHCQESLRLRIVELSEHQRARLAEAPFLLFTFHERDERYWSRVLRDPGELDLFRSSGSEDVDTLVSASLGFVWQLARRNPYSLRLFCGATLYWCDRIAELTFYRLLEAVRCSGDVPALRLAGNISVWRKLLNDGVSRESRIRSAAQLGALQAVLTEPQESNRDQWSLAARSVRIPGLRVADEKSPEGK